MEGIGDVGIAEDGMEADGIGDEGIASDGTAEDGTGVAGMVSVGIADDGITEVELPVVEKPMPPYGPVAA